MPILEHGTEEQKRKYLPMLTTGGVLGGMGITEPNAGSDASKSQTQACLAGAHSVVKDSKIVSSRTARSGACKMGLHGVHTSEIVFIDRIVPKENLLGQEGKGFKICMQTLDMGRIGIAAQARRRRRESGAVGRKEVDRRAPLC